MSDGPQRTDLQAGGTASAHRAYSFNKHLFIQQTLIVSLLCAKFCVPPWRFRSERHISCPGDYSLVRVLVGKRKPYVPYLCDGAVHGSEGAQLRQPQLWLGLF